MIKGYLLNHKPQMDKYSDADIMSQMDPLKEHENQFDYESTINGEKVGATRRVMFSDNLYIATYTADDEVKTALWEIYKILNNGAKEFIKAFELGKAIIVAWPRYPDNSIEDATYTVMIEELIRLTAFFCKEFGAEEEIVADYIRSYINLCVAYDGEDR